MHGSKICFKCGTEKPITEFYKHSKMRDGYLGKCKECTKADVKKRRDENIDYVRAYDRARGKLPHRIKSAIEQCKKWRAEDSRRMKCHNAVYRALRNGLLAHSPCIICGNENSLAHHPDYDKPLEVVWLCQVHHKEAHKLMNESDN